MNLKASDIGYLYVKSYSLSDEEPMIFKSSYTTGEAVYDGTAHITIDGVSYYVGVQNGITVSMPDKTDNLMNKILYLTDLALTGSDDYFIVTGLPISQYQTQKEKLINAIMGYNKSEVVYHDVPMKINIQDVTVYPQGASALYAMNKTNGDFIIFDIGGRTICVAYIEMINGLPKILQKDTWFKGISTLHSRIIEAVNNRYSQTFEPSYAEKIIKKGFLRIDGEEKDISFIKMIYREYMDDIFHEFELNYPYCHATDIYLCGGGAILLENVFKKKFADVTLIDNSQFANALGLFKIGLQKYYKYFSSYCG